MKQKRKPPSWVITLVILLVIAFMFLALFEECVPPKINHKDKHPARFDPAHR